MTTIAGGSKSCRARLGGNVLQRRDEDALRRGVVAAAITAAPAYRGAQPARISAAAMRSRLCITM